MDKEGWWRTQVETGYWVQVHMMFLGIPWYFIGIPL